MLAYVALLATFASIGLLIWLYIRANDAKLMRLPPGAASFSPRRFTPEDARVSAKEVRENPIRIEDILPPKTGRRYIVIGGVRSFALTVESWTMVRANDCKGVGFTWMVGGFSGGMDCTPLVGEGRGPEEDSRAGY